MAVTTVGICLPIYDLYLGTSIVATVDNTRTGVPSIFHVKCEVLIAEGSHRYSCCKKHRKSLCAMATRDLTNHRTGKDTNDVQLQEEANELIVSLPVSAYSDSPASSIEILQNRLRSHGALPSGTDL